jgi:rare lipoprotein A
MQQGRSWRALAAAAALAATLLASGCATRAPAVDRDGPGANPPANLAQVPDAQPRVEPLRVGGPNKPYSVLGQSYTPLTGDLPLSEAGGASWYGRKFHGKPTASGEAYDMYAMTAAHKTMPIPSYARVRNPANGREVIVRVNDRGPFSEGRVIDLSYTAALKLGVLRGVAPVEVKRITHSEIRAGLAAPAVPPPDDPAPGDTPGLAPGWWLQLGAFRSRDGALQHQQRVQSTALVVASTVAVVSEDSLHRVLSGPFGSREDAQAAADTLRGRHGLPSTVVERR